MTLTVIPRDPDFQKGRSPPKVSGRSARTPIIAEFQPDAIEIEERRPARVARLTLYIVAALIIAAVTWATISHVDEVITASGKLITTSPNLVVQPLETSVVRAIHVSVGDIVQTGQELATLDPTFSQADVEQLRSRIAALEAQINRLEAELSGRDFSAYMGANADEMLQARLFVERKAHFDASLHNFDAQIARDQADLDASRNEERSAAGRLAALTEIENMRGTLLEHKNGSRLSMLQSRDARLDVDANLSRIRGSQVEISHRIEKTRSERQVFIEEFRRNALEQLVETRAKRDTAAEELKKAELRRNMIVMTAPADAVVLDIAQRSIGSIVREAETLFVLVPLNIPLEAEVSIDSKDIGQLAVGQAVRLKFDAFPFQKHGTASGKIRVLSQDAFGSDTRGEQQQRSSRAPPLFFRARIELTDVHLRGLPESFQMVPGMAVTAEMKIGQRSVISYFLYPLLRGLDESIREP